MSRVLARGISRFVHNRVCTHESSGPVAMVPLAPGASAVIAVFCKSSGVVAVTSAVVAVLVRLPAAEAVELPASVELPLAETVALVATPDTDADADADMDAADDAEVGPWASTLEAASYRR